MKKHSFLVIKTFIILILFVASAAPQQKGTIKKYLDDKEKVYEEICNNFGLQTWNLYSLEGPADIQSAKEKFRKLFTDEELKKNIKGWGSEPEIMGDQSLKRRIDVWKKILDAASIEYSPEIIKLSSSLLEDVRNRDTKDAAKTKELQARVIELIKKRNELALVNGYNNYAEFVLESTGLGAKWFYEFVESVDKKTLPVYKELFDKIKNEKGAVSIGDIARFQKNLPAPSFSKDSLFLVMSETLADIGIDYGKLPIRFVIKEADFGGNCIGVRIPEDMRVVMVPNMPVSVYLHELGHGLQWMKTAIESPLLEGYEWCMGGTAPAFYEGMAQTLAGFSKHPEWYKKYARFTDEKIKGYTSVDKFNEAVKIRFNLINFMLEIELYKNPDRDPGELFSSLIEKYLLLENIKYPFSMVNTLYVDYPCYLHNYFLADIIAWQVHDALKNRFGGNYLFDKHVGEFMADNLYKDGMLLEWQQILKRATGKTLDVEGYLKQLGI